MQQLDTRMQTSGTCPTRFVHACGTCSWTMLQQTRQPLSPLAVLGHLGRTIADGLRERSRIIRAVVDEMLPLRRRPYPDAFAAALRGMAEIAPNGDLPSGTWLGATIAALDALEAALPERGAIADWQARQARSAGADAYRSARGSWEEYHVALPVLVRYLELRGWR